MPVHVHSLWWLPATVCGRIGRNEIARGQPFPGIDVGTLGFGRRKSLGASPFRKPISFLKALVELHPTKQSS